MKFRAPAAALLLLFGTCLGTASGADRPVLHMATASAEVAVWCLSNGFIYEPGFVAPLGAPVLDYEKTLLSPAQAILAVDRGELAMSECVSLETITQAYAKGAHNLMIVAVNSVSPAYVLIGSKNVKRLADLKGKVLGSNGMSTIATEAIVSILQKGANLVPDRDYNFIVAQTGAARMAALVTGKVDAIAAFPPSSYQLIDQGYPLLGVERQYVPNYIQGVMVVNRQWAQANRPLLVSIIKATVQTGHWLKDPRKKNDVITKLADVTKGGTKLGPDYARRIYSDIVTVKGGVLEDAYADRDVFMTTYRLMTERGLIAENEYPPLDKLVDYSYLNQARHELGMRDVKPLTP